ncbi:hypothetical protein [Paracoccus sp. 22332]|uniref:hypothetical protein n=1 Tax=Paracoccus sp. 22332 TaxID=3453913 RepID=UPI003F85C8B4
MLDASSPFPVSADEQAAGVPATFVPASEEDWELALKDPWWRLTSGQLYQIMVKGDDDDEDSPGHVAPFIPNVNQLEFLQTTHDRSVITKARQLGFTTLIAIMWLDHALFVPDQRCLLIAHKLDDAKKIFRDKIKFAYDRLPEPLREAMPTAKLSADEMLFAHNNSSLAVSTSARSGTIHRLHISEMGKIAVRDPGKAVEIVTGSLPAVPKSGWAFIESTAEGTEGEFFRIAKAAEDRWRAKQDERPGVWAFRFYPWFKEPGYRMDPRDYPISPEMHEYFDAVEAEMDTTLTLEQRAWYIWKREFEFSGDPEKMHREMPSTPEECWMTSNEGTWYAQQLARVRAEGRIGKVPLVTGVPINTFWDIGNSDGTAIWLHQQVGLVHRFPFFIEGWEEPYAHFIAELEKRGHVWGAHFLPHDATQERQGERSTISPLIMLRNLRPGWDWRVVPRVHDLQHGIQTTRTHFAQAWFDADGCAAGIDRLTNYRKRWNKMLGRYVDEPVKADGNSEGADAFRQWAQAMEHKMLTPRALVQDRDDPLAIPRRRKTGRRVSGLTA